MGIWRDSYMAYDSTPANLLTRWTNYTGTITINQSGGRGGRGAAVIGGGSLQKTLGPSDTWFFGTCIKVNILNIANPIFRLLDSGSTQLDFTIQTDGTIKVTRGVGGTILGITTFALHANTEYYIEIKSVIGNAGSVDLWVNGALRLSISADTQFTANASANSFHILGVPGLFTTFCDTVVRYGADAVGNLDDYFVKALFVDGDGNYSDWTPAVVGPNYLMVNKTEPDFATYVQSTTPGNRDSYVLEALNEPNATIYSVTLIVVAEKDDGGVREIELFNRSGGVDYDSGTTEAISVGPIGYEHTWKTNPATGIAWTPAEVDAIEVGQEHVT